MSNPLCIDLFCGLGGWTEGLLAEGWHVIGFDIERHEYGGEKYPAQLVLQDVLTIHGSQFRDAALIVASPPCQEYSYMAMPWSRAKEKQARIEADADERKRLTALFDACFRIQREAIEAAGHFIPMVVENVRGANKWVGRSRWNYGSFHLWGDVPALMPMTKAIPKNVTGGSWFQPMPGRKIGGNCPDGRNVQLYINGVRETDGKKVAGFRFDGSGKSFQTASVEGMKSVHDGTKVPSVEGRRTDVGKGARFTSDCDGTKQGGDWFSTEGSISRTTGSKSSARKAASARIAKIPLALSRHIAAYWKPRI